MTGPPIDRRKLLGGLTLGASGLLLAGCDKLNGDPAFRSILKSAEGLHRGRRDFCSSAGVGADAQAFPHGLTRFVLLRSGDDGRAESSVDAGCPCFEPRREFFITQPEVAHLKVSLPAQRLDHVELPHQQGGAQAGLNQQRFELDRQLAQGHLDPPTP